VKIKRKRSRAIAQQDNSFLQRNELLLPMNEQATPHSFDGAVSARFTHILRMKFDMEHVEFNQ
jgi:hypothetical protein